MRIFNTIISQGSVATLLRQSVIFGDVYCKFPRQCANEGTFKAGHYLLKIRTKVRCLPFSLTVYKVYRVRQLRRAMAVFSVTILAPLGWNGVLLFVPDGRVYNSWKLLNFCTPFDGFWWILATSNDASIQMELKRHSLEINRHFWKVSFADMVYQLCTSLGGPNTLITIRMNFGGLVHAPIAILWFVERDSIWGAARWSTKSTKLRLRPKKPFVPVSICQGHFHFQPFALTGGIFPPITMVGNIGLATTPLSGR